MRRRARATRKRQRIQKRVAQRHPGRIRCSVPSSNRGPAETQKPYRRSSAVCGAGKDIICGAVRQRLGRGATEEANAAETVRFHPGAGIRGTMQPCRRSSRGMGISSTCGESGVCPCRHRMTRDETMLCPCPEIWKLASGRQIPEFQPVPVMYVHYVQVNLTRGSRQNRQNLRSGVHEGREVSICMVAAGWYI